MAALGETWLERHPAALSTLNAGAVLANREHGRYDYRSRHSIRRAVQYPDPRFPAIPVRWSAGMEYDVQFSHRGRHAFYRSRILHQANQAALLILCLPIELEQADHFRPQLYHLLRRAALLRDLAGFRGAAGHSRPAARPGQRRGRHALYRHDVSAVSRRPAADQLSRPNRVFRDPDHVEAR